MDIQKIRPRERGRLRERLTIFLRDPYHPTLHNHPLRGKYLDYRSINITGDLRAIFKYINNDDCVFVALGTHHDLYE